MKKILTLIFAACFLLHLDAHGQTVLLQEDFSSGALPADWSNDSLGLPATGLWEFTNPGIRNIAGAGFDTSFVILDSDHYGQGVSQLASLTTDTFSAAGYSGVTVEIDEQYFTQSAPGSFRKIEASGDQGATWYTLVMDSVTLGYPIAIHHSLTLDTLAGTAGIQLRFTFSGSWDFWWALDNLKVTGFTPCTAPPTAGQALASHDSVCATTAFDLSLSGNSMGTGLTYQWQSSPDSVTWTAMPGDTLPVTRTSQSSAAYYRCLATCSGQTDSSGIVWVAMNPAPLCYCIPQTPACSNINYISGVSISGTTLNNNSACQENDSGYAYVSYPASGNTTALVHQNSTYDFSVSSTGSNIISLWIDYDQSGTFDSLEWYQVTTLSSLGSPSIVSIEIPDSVPQGLTGMRIRTRAAGNANGYGDACTSFLSGETEDYYIYVDTLLSGIRELAFPGLVVYPNPASASVTVTFEKAGKDKVTLTLFNLIGSVCSEMDFLPGNRLELPLSGLSEGMYLLKIAGDEGFTVRKLAVKR